MSPDAIANYIIATFPDAQQVKLPSGDAFFFFKDDQRMPLATIVHSDAFDAASDLNRAGVFRLNIGIKKETYESLFGPPPKATPNFDVVSTGHDFTKLDELMPHPIYAPMMWVCVLSPSDTTFERIKPLLAEAYNLAVKRYQPPR